MNDSITLQDLLNKLREYNPEEVEIVKRAYEYADTLHKGQMRQSGEPYISHPLNVAYILTDMHADRDTICAGLLHDTLEDTKNAWNLTALNNVVDEVYSKYGLDKKIIVTETGTPDSFKSYYSPANTNLTNASIPEENGKAVTLYINGLFESNIKNSEVIEGLVIWFSIFNGGEETKKLIYKYIRGEV